VLAVALLLGSADPITTVFSVALVVMVVWLLAMVPAQIRQAKGWPWLVSQVGTASATPLQLLYVLIVGLIALSVHLGVDILMGTVLAGLVMRRYVENPQTSVALKQLETSAYGLFVPLFFVVAGSRLDLASVAANPWGPVLCLAGILVIRGLPQWWLYRRTVPDPIERLRFSLLVSQSLNLPIVVGYLEVQAGLMSPEVGAALMGGSLLSVLVLPAVALAIKR
jgi:Kef-type K+ transport system membrane component KefB